MRAALANASPSSTAGIANFGPGRNASAHSSPTATRYKDILDSPNWRRSAGFVRQSAVSNDDPFVSNQAAPQSVLQGKDPASTSVQQHVTDLSSQYPELPST